MSFIKYVERFKRMHLLIKLKATGTSSEFAEKIGISRSILMENIKEMKELGAPIVFCRKRNSYLYSKKCNFVVDFKADDFSNEEKRRVVGGHSWDSVFYMNYAIMGSGKVKEYGG